MDSADTPRRSRRLAGLAPVAPVAPPPTGEFMTEHYYPNRTPRNGTSCTYLSSIAAGVVGILALARVAAAAFSTNT